MHCIIYVKPKQSQLEESWKTSFDSVYPKYNIIYL